MKTFPFQRPPVDPTPGLCRKAERDTILSSCATAMGDVPFTDASIIILYAAMLGAGEGVSMVTTAFMFCALGFLGIPMAWVTLHGKSYQKTIIFATILALMMFGAIAMAPFFGSAAIPVLLCSLFAFSLCHTVYISAWFPLLDTFLTPERRSTYFGNMRFAWQLVASLLLFCIGAMIGKNPPIWKLQLAMVFSLCVYSIKLYLIAQVPNFRIPVSAQTKNLPFGEGLKKVLQSKPLTGYSVYLFVLNLAAYGTIPLTTLYMRNALKAPDNVIVMTSSIVLAGMLVGSFCSGRLIKWVGIRSAFLVVHCIYAVTNFALFFLGKGVLPDGQLFFAIAATLFVYSFFFACANIASSSEMLYLAPPGNKVMAMAFCNSFNYAGCGIARLLSSIVLGSGALAPHWFAFGREFCHYQTMFLVYGVCVVFAASLLVVVPAIFPKGEYIYSIHR